MSLPFIFAFPEKNGQGSSKDQNKSMNKPFLLRKQFQTLVEPRIKLLRSASHISQLQYILAVVIFRYLSRWPTWCSLTSEYTCFVLPVQYSVFLAVFDDILRNLRKNCPVLHIFTRQEHQFLKESSQKDKLLSFAQRFDLLGNTFFSFCDNDHASDFTKLWHVRAKRYRVSRKECPFK